MASPAVAQLPASFPPVPREPLNTENRPATVPTDALPPPALSAPALSVTKTSGSTRELAVPSPAPVPQAQTLIQPKPISIAAEPAKEPVKAPSLFHRRTPSASGSHGSNGSANEANGVAPAAKASKPGLFSRIFHLHDEDSKSPAPGGQQHTEKKKEPGLVDKLFHRERTESAASDRGSASSPALSLNTHGSAKESSNSDRAGTPSTPTEGFGSGLGIFRELWSGSPAPSEGSSHVEQGHGQGKRQASLSRPPSSAALQEKEKASTSLKRTNSEQQLAKYGDMDGKVIGRGATSVVRLAQKKDLPAGSLPTEKSEDNKTYAIKEFRKRRRDETERDYVRKLSTEFCIGHSLHHPNVVSHLELLQTQTGAWCEVLEYCSGGDLCSMIQHGGLTYDEANVFLVQLINGVSYLHGMGVAHKDLKPENLMLDGKGSLKITDFGSAEVFRSVWEKEAHKSHRLAGSEPYIAPEEFTEKEFDPRAVDVWACGIIYLTMIYNRIPWRSATGTDPNYKFYVRCRTKYAAAHNLPRKSEAKEGSAATLVGQNPEGKESKTDLSRSNSAQIPREKEIKSHKVSASVGGSESTSFPMLDHLPSGPRNLIFRMLDPNPETRISIDDVRKDSWFRNVVKSHLGEGWCSLSEEGTERGLRERPGAAVTCVAGKESGSSRDRQREGSSSGSGSGSLSVSRSGSGGIARSGSGSLTRPKEERNEVVAGSGAVPAQAVPK